MPSLPCFNRHFTPKWQMTLLTTIAVALLTFLGHWQLQRAGEKKGMIASVAAAARQQALDWSANQPLPKQYQALSVSGRYLPRILLLDNQYHAHQIGYDVLTPMLLDTGQVILIDRGWVKADQDRRQLPEISHPVRPLRLSGQAYYPSEKLWVLGELIEKKTPKTTLIEKIDTKIISQLLHKSVYPFIIRLDKSEADGYVRDWAVVSMPPERHKAYALQWFAMAFVLIVLFITLNLKKTDEKSATP